MFNVFLCVTMVNYVSISVITSSSQAVEILVNLILNNKHKSNPTHHKSASLDHSEVISECEYVGYLLFMEHDTHILSSAFMNTLGLEGSFAYGHGDVGSKIGHKNS